MIQSYIQTRGTQMNTFQIKNYKSIRGDEGDAFESALWINGKRAAYVRYDGNGGPYRWRWLSATGGPVIDEWNRAYQVENIEHTITVSPDGVEITEFYDDNAMVNPCFEPFSRRNRQAWIEKKTELGHELAGDCWEYDDVCYAQLIHEHLVLKRLRRDAKKHTLVVRPDDELYGETVLGRIETYLVYRYPYSDKLRAWIIENEPEGVRILNDELAAA